MERKVKIDLLRDKYDLDASRHVRFVFFGRILLFGLLFVAMVATAFTFRVAQSTDTKNGLPGLSLFSTIRSLVQAGDRQLKGEQEDRINFLLLGIGGAGHEGPQLTDTILLSSFKPSTAEVGLLSIPRDLSVPMPGYGWRKINHANAFGELKEPGSGPLFASQVIGDIFHEPVHYYVRVDFDGFAKLIDDLGGIDIKVDRSFTDSRYPIDGLETTECGSTETIETSEIPNPESIYDCRFEVLSFAEGWNRMNGKTALKYVRSRHGTNGEASDFARSRRQQKVLVAVKEKVFSTSTLLNPSRIIQALDTLKANIATNLTSWEILRLAQEFKRIETNKISSHVLDASPDSPLYATSLNGAYVLLPKKDDWGELERITDRLFTLSSNEAHAAEPTGPAPARIEIQNGTNVTGMAARASRLLENQGYVIARIGNASERSYTHTLIYDFTDGARAEELKGLRKRLQADVILSASGWLVSGDLVPDTLSLHHEDYAKLAATKQIDFLVILGENAANVLTP
ncbi:MAG: Cell envelope-related transcriptional attenuator [Candidatus Uhrbacteria bacterium GW2011_GWA2_53_10]|uniref:Cell envelope-related transcriptional attenuator n=1 Tax=Candidatus Uhrbacteria bacterium GW2011_GWA2_53_10 TaxID=1618980 RepID=A0A0G1XPX4_9BACT|nr:MAG: Cell envelope-related transcriptional attenuator [Candidatus Uhrbacteria bacterium GW2011_GWA2_53_10]